MAVSEPERLCPSCDRSFDASLDKCPSDGSRLIVLKPGDSLIGRELDGRYRLTEPLGEGGMGTVYRALQKSVSRDVAVKVILPALSSNAVAVKRFLREAKLASKLTHANTVMVIDFGQTEDHLLYLAMELLQGRTLIDVLKADGPFPADRLVRIGTQVADALDAAHQLSIIHRDIKPSNIMVLDSPAGRDALKVLDFGLARSLEADDNTKVTATGMVVGTPSYTPPEVARGGEATAQSDLYSLGVVLYELATGRRIFKAQDQRMMMVMHIQEKPAPLPASVPHRLAAVIMKLLEKDPARRFATAAETHTALSSAVTLSGSALSAALVVGASPSGPMTVDAKVLTHEAPESIADRLEPASVQAPVTERAPPPARVGAGAGAAKKRPVVAIALALAGALLIVAAVVGMGIGRRKSGKKAGAAAAMAPGGDAGAAKPAGAAVPMAPTGKNPYTVSDERLLASAAAIWTSQCAGCHGQSGDGAGRDIPPGLEPKSFADVNAIPGMLDLYRYEVIRRGIEQDGKPAMPSFADKLSEDDTWKVVTYVSTLAKPIEPEQPPAPPATKPPLNAAMVKRGAWLFRMKCASCHGPKGLGNGPAHEFLGRHPGDLTTGVYKLRSTEKGLLPTDDDIFRTLTAGMGMGGMPAFAKLSEDDRWALVAFVKTLAKRFDKQKKEPEFLVVPPRPKPTPAAIVRGEAAYRAAGCAQCHGERGRADGPRAAKLEDYRKNPVKPTDFSAPFLFVGGSSPDAIYRTMMTGVGGTPMPQGSDFFDAESAWDVVEYIISLGTK